MCEEVTADNFAKVFPRIHECLKKAKFVAIDTEFSATNTEDSSDDGSLFDAPKDRYRKLRNLAQKIIPLQVGVSAFRFDVNKYKYVADTFTFYLFPRSCGSVTRSFYVNASSFEFLHRHHFDFNKFMNGISYVNRSEKVLLQNCIDSIDDLINCELHYGMHIDLVNEALKLKKPNETVFICDVANCDYTYNYCLRQYIHRKYKAWSYIAKCKLYAKFVDDETLQNLLSNNNLEEELKLNMLGFSQIFEMLVTSRVPIVGHNLLTDLLILMNCMGDGLPRSYESFKKSVNKLFPVILDTKQISNVVHKTLPRDKNWSISSLSGLYDYFRNGFGRHWVRNSPCVENNYANVADDAVVDFHNAGYDSFCSGYIFVRMAHILVNQQNPVFKEKRQFTSGELLLAVTNIRNRIYTSNCTARYLVLDGADPIDTRPPFLIIKPKKNRHFELAQVEGELNKFGFAEFQQPRIVPMFQQPYALVAVENFTSARKILKEFANHPEYHVRQYSKLRHSPFLRGVLWTSAVATSALFLILTHRLLK